MVCLGSDIDPVIVISNVIHIDLLRNWRHRPNRDCVRWLIKEVWPLVRQEMPDVDLDVYGANQTPEDAALDDPAIGARVPRQIYLIVALAASE